MSAAATTKLVYFLCDEKTPYLITLPFSSEDVTLGHLKSALGALAEDRRFFFRTLDEEVGEVKEEISDDGAKLPSFEGRIFAWLQRKDRHFWRKDLASKNPRSDRREQINSSRHHKLFCGKKCSSWSRLSENSMKSELGSGSLWHSRRWSLQSGNGFPSSELKTVCVALHPNGGPLGIEIKKVENDLTSKIVVTDLHPGGCADLDGRLGIGDELVAVNWKAVTGAPVESVVAALRHECSQSKDVILTVKKTGGVGGACGPRCTACQSPSSPARPQLNLSIMSGPTAVMEAMTASPAALKAKNRTWLNVELSDTFHGSDICDWLTSQVPELGKRSDAKKYADKLLRLGFIQSFFPRSGFSRHCWYKFAPLPERSVNYKERMQCSTALSESSISLPDLPPSYSDVVGHQSDWI